MNVPYLSADLIQKFTIATLLLVLTFSLLSLVGTHLYLELTTHFRLQYLLAAIACMAVLVAFQSWKFVPLAVCCGVLNLLPILPYYSAVTEARASTDLVRFKLLDANVLESNRNYAGLLDVIRKSNPDVIVLQEFTKEWQAHTEELVNAYPFTLLDARPSGAGMAILSRHPFITTERLTLDASIHVALLAQVEIETARLTILALHPTTPVTPRKFRNRNLQFAAAASIMRAAAEPKLLVGDLNCTMWSPYFERLIRDSGLRDARRGFGMVTTWPLPLPGFLRLPIDHCLISEELLVEGFRTGANTGSDHSPLIFDLAMPKSRR